MSGSKKKGPTRMCPHCGGTGAAPAALRQAATSRDPHTNRARLACGRCGGIGRVPDDAPKEPTP